MKKKLTVWMIILALAVSSMAYAGFRAPAAIVTATAIPDFDDSLSTAYEMGSKTTIQYAVDEENEKYDINVLYRFTATEDHKYQIHIGGIAEDQDTYVNANVIDADLNEYASFSTCGLEPGHEDVSWQTEADLQLELLGGRTYYVMLTCMSHEYKGVYEGTYDFCMSEAGEMDTGVLSEEEAAIEVSADQTEYKKVRADRSGWYELNLRREEENEADESAIWLDVYDAGGNPVEVNEGKCYLEQDAEYDVLIRMAEDTAGASETIRVNIQKIKESSVSKETGCTWTNSASCAFTAEETEEIIIYSHSVSADPRITVVKDGGEITGNEDYPWGGSKNEKDFGVVCSVEKGQVYTFLMDDNNESGDEVTVYVETWRDPEAAETPKVSEPPAPSKTPDISPSESTSPVQTGAPFPSESASPVQTDAPSPAESVVPSQTKIPQIPSTPPAVTLNPMPPSTQPTVKPSVSPTALPAVKPGTNTSFVPMLPSQAVTPVFRPESSPSPASVGIGKVLALKLKRKKRTVTVSWKKVSGASGYQICYSTSKKWKGKKQKTVTQNKVVIKKLKKNKTYYFRVRAYRLEGTKKVYGAWSSAKKIRIKK